jgi:hydroxylaminobenzene mutase
VWADASPVGEGYGARMMDQARRRVIWHGVLLYLLGLLMGTATSVMANPRMGLSAHVGTVVNAILLVALGAGWDAATLSPRAERAAFWLLVVSSYGGSFGLLLAAMLGTHDSTPIHGAAQSAAAWKEVLVNAVLTGFGVAMLAGTVVVLRGFGRARGVSATTRG